MKKIIIGILAATAMLFFISCSEGTVENNNSESNSVDKNTNVVENETKETNKYDLSKLYDVKLAGDIEGEVFKNNADIYMIDNPECVLRINSSIPESVKIGTKQVMAMPLEDTLYTYSGKEVRYLSEDSNTYYEVGARGKRCMIYGKNGGVLSAYDGTGVTEEGFLKHVRDYIGQYVNLSSIEDYKYSCYTNIKEYGEKGYWTKRENGFYTTSDENKEVYLYLFCFTLYSGGIATSDSVTVTCDKSGNILGLNFEQSGVEWDSVTVNVTKFERSIEAFINNYVSDLNNLTKYYVKNKQLTVYKNEIYMKVYVEATFNDGKNEYDVLCPMLVKLDKRIESESVGTEKS